MATTQDSSVGFSFETAYKTPVVTSRWLEYVDESLDWNKNIKQGKGLRVGTRVARSARRVVPTADGGGDVTVEAISKGMGLFWQAALGAGVSTLVSAGLYQQVFTLADQPQSLTIQKGLVEVGGTVDAYTFLGAMITAFEIDFTNDDICTVKATVDAGDISTSIAYAAPSYAAGPNLFHFANGSIQSGVLTSPTATALGVGATPVADIRGGSISVNHNMKTDRFNFGAGGRKAKPTVGLRDVSGKMDVEYDATTWAQAVLSEAPMSLVLNYTAGMIGAGVETLQIIVPEIKFDSEMPKSNGGDLITESMSWVGLDNLTAAQPLWVVTRTADAAL